MSFTKRFFEAEQIRQRELNLQNDEDYQYEQYLRAREWEELFYVERPEELKKYRQHEKKN